MRYIAIVLMSMCLQGCSAVTLIPRLYEAAMIATANPIPPALNPATILRDELAELLNDSDENEPQQ